MISLTSMSSGCSIAKATARAIESAAIANSRMPATIRAVSACVIVSASSDSTGPGETIEIPYVRGGATATTRLTLREYL